ncbi:metallophosphoesterase [Myxosarcina sp. GI1]|uniref:metallophosphoesterase family protein n=1 Tax=Myxosarcina sp. GI1 TaxID=1541065 RepID=UPI00068BA154|nr:metallophosphoesterase [Myxosarcina sp. GI1]
MILSIGFTCLQTIGRIPILSETARTNTNTENLFVPPRSDVRIAVISDLNSAYGATDYEPEIDRAIALLSLWQPDLVLCGGDMVAGQNPALTEPEIKAMWQAFDDHVAAPLRQAKIPFGFTIGNHDASSALGIEGQYLFQQERDLAQAYWQDPQHDPGVRFVDRFEFPFYYTFEHQGIFFLVWDGSSSKIPANKLAWVEKTLASRQAQQAKMRILLGHLPLYGVAVGRDEAGEVMDNADRLRAMLEKYNVHTYVSGHHHAYYPGHRGKLQLLHTGILGSGIRPLLDSSLPPQKTITIVDINFDLQALSTYTTYDMQTLELIKKEQLPRFIAAHNGIILRHDIELADLKPEEKAFCLERLNSKLCGLSKLGNIGKSIVLFE